MFPDSGPTARALLTLELLQSNPGINAAEIARRLGVSERAARRTITILRDAGIPVDGVRGPHGGYRLGPGLRRMPLMLTATEALGLVMAVLDGHHAAGRDDEPVGSALGKLISTLPTNVGRQAALMRRHAQAAPDDPDGRPDQSVTAALVTAVAEQRRARIGYRTSRSEWEEVVDPWGVVVRYGRWYLVCRSHRALAVRTYRVDRVVSVDPLDESCDVPEGLDLVALLEEHLGLGWELPTRVVIDAPIARVAPWVRPAWGRLSPYGEAGDRTLLEGSTSNPEMYAGEWLARLPFAFTVEGGDELRHAMARLAARLAASLDARTA